MLIQINTEERPRKRICLESTSAWESIPYELFMEVFEGMHGAFKQAKDTLSQLCLVCRHWTDCSAYLKLKLANVHRASMHHLFGYNQTGIYNFIKKHNASLLHLHIAPHQNIDLSQLQLAQLKSLILEKSLPLNWTWMTHLPNLSALQLTFEPSFLDLAHAAKLIDPLLSSLAKMSALTSLDLACLNPHMGTFLPLLTNLTALKSFPCKIELDDNSLKSLPLFKELLDIHLDPSLVEMPALFQNLTTLTKLVELNIEGNGTDCNLDLQFICNLTNLTSVDIGFIENVTDEQLKFFSTLTNLESLRLSEWDLEGSGFQFLQPLTALTHLTLWSCLRVQLNFIAYLTSLEIFECDCLYEEDLIYLAHLTGLRELELNDISNGAKWSFLDELIHLEELGLASSTLSMDTFENLAKICNLHTLRISNCEFDAETFAELHYLEGLTSLEIVEGSLDAEFFRQPFLANLCKLTLFALDFENVEAFSLMTNLTDLRLDTLPAIDDELISHLTALTSLKILSLRNLTVSDQSLLNLTCLTNLTTLSMKTSQVSQEVLQTAFSYIKNFNLIK